MCVLALALFVACSEALPEPSSPSAVPDSVKTARSKPPLKPQKSRLVDPRKGGFELGLGEWALTPEAKAIRPGKVTFVIENRGTMAHGFEIALEGESSGNGSGNLFKSESALLQPGESTRMTVTLAPGAYEIECLVEGHDDMGMEGVLEVRRDAPLVKTKTAAKPDAVAIADFAFSPAIIKVERGTKVTWRNDDPTEHTVTADDGSFTSDALSSEQVFSHRFEEPGVFAYKCAIHPGMTGKVRVE